MSLALPELILIAAACFNAVLAVINGHVVGLSRAHVVLAEIAIYATALAVIVFNADRRMWPWFMLTLFILLMGLLIALGNGEFNPKYIRDVLVIPVFIMLGMTYRAGSFVKPFLVLQTIVFMVGLIEVVSPDAYANTFRVLDYYINTRDFSANSFWNVESTLFVSATRPGARFFGFVDWHRGSSIFLEPVSLGNYCVVAAILIIACWRDLGGWTRYYLIGSTGFILIACDGRLATASILIVFFSLLFLRNVSSRWSALYLPAILFASSVYIWAVGKGDSYDDFVGRVSGTIDFLQTLNLLDFSGMNARTAESAADAGIVYFILSQSLLGVIVIWLSVCLLASGQTSPSRTYVHAIMIFIPLNLLVSYSFFTIKVASLIWFFYGYHYVDDLEFEATLSRDQKFASATARPATSDDRARGTA